MQTGITRRQVLRSGATAAAIAALNWGHGRQSLAAADDAPAVKLAGPVHQDPSVDVLHPRGRVPVSFIIDDSTCLVNMGSYCIPQFAQAWPQQAIYKRPWKTWPREIPDDFVREFGEWCGAAGVRGKYSIVPNPACVGWLDRELPGWGREELQASLKLVRELMVPNWDITPEMVTHTRVIDIKTGRPMEKISNATMENSYPHEQKSADEIGAYVAYALRILKNCELPCTGITTPGGFGNKAKAELALGVRQAVADVFAAEIPFYFKYVSKDKESTRPKLEAMEGVGTDAVKFVVNVPASTGDEFGGWTGERPPQPDRYANADATSGRMVELIEKGEPAVMLCHWAGLYSHGTKKGFEAAKGVISAINKRFADRIIWMKNSELARYEVGRQLTRIDREGNQITLTAPFATPAYTVKVSNAMAARPTAMREGKVIELTEAGSVRDLKAGMWVRTANTTTVCLDFPKGKVTLGV